MRLPLEFHPRVRDEIAEAVSWYDERRLGLGSEFVEELSSVFEEIENNPARYGFATPQVREAILNRFPFAVYYRAMKDRIRVLSVMHAARDPNTWQFRE